MASQQRHMSWSMEHSSAVAVYRRFAALTQTELRVSHYYADVQAYLQRLICNLLLNLHNPNKAMCRTTVTSTGPPNLKSAQG